MSVLIKRADLWIKAHKGKQKFTVAYTAELIADMKAEIERLSKPYVPMTEDEIYELFINHDSERVSSLVAIQEAVIDRYNEQRGVK